MNEYWIFKCKFISDTAFELDVWMMIMCAGACTKSKENEETEVATFV